SKVHLTIVIPGTVYPRSDSAQIRDRQLEQEPGLPEEIGLSSSPRPDHDVDTLGRSPPPRRVDAGLIESAVAPLHFEIDALRPGTQQVVPRCKGAFDGPRSCLGRSPEVSGLSEGGDDLLVASRARSSSLRERV